MNLRWTSLTRAQRAALSILHGEGPCLLPQELGEQLINLGLVEPLHAGGYCITAMGSTLVPPTIH